MKWRIQMEHTRDNLPAADAASVTVARRSAFSTTHWSAVLAVREGDATSSAAALEKLCQHYWYPIYAFIRRRGSDPHAAEDLTQAFFAHLLDQETLKKVAREKGKVPHFSTHRFDPFSRQRMGSAADLETRRAVSDFFAG